MNYLPSHRKENEPSSGGALPFNQYPPQQHLPLPTTTHKGILGIAQPVAPPQRAAAPPLALSSSSDGGGSRDEMEGYYSNPSSNNPGKKRFRTKFTREQKDKMLNLAECLDWKIQKQDEEMVQQFCSEMGINRLSDFEFQVKIWDFLGVCVGRIEVKM
ncbi:hypothetical protein DH2020_023041 [Rehmannia glutinosa]|uniref:Uncharacterized protein n=1 Tax=Rehmannia glutinosa TaxID=99300 RepID=A0ABR0W4X3_REHGL